MFGYTGTGTKNVFCYICHSLVGDILIYILCRHFWTKERLFSIKKTLSPTMHSAGLVITNYNVALSVVAMLKNCRNPSSSTEMWKNLILKNKYWKYLNRILYFYNIIFLYLNTVWLLLYRIYRLCWHSSKTKWKGEKRNFK